MFIKKNHYKVKLKPGAVKMSKTAQLAFTHFVL